LDTVAGDVTDLVAAHPCAFGPVLDGVHTAGDVHAARVGADADLLLPGFFARLFEDAGDKIRCKPLRGVLELRLCHDGERQLCEVVAAHVLDVCVSDHVDGRIRAVAPEALAAADCYFFHYSPCLPG